MSYNKVILIGRLTRDPELKTTPASTVVTSFTIAVDRPPSKDKQHPEADFINCVAWRTTGEFVAKHFSKGDQILIEGSLHNRSYTDKDQKKKTVTEITVNNVSFVEKRKTATDTSNVAESTTNDFVAADDSQVEEELPF